MPRTTLAVALALLLAASFDARGADGPVRSGDAWMTFRGGAMLGSSVKLGFPGTVSALDLDATGTVDATFGIGGYYRTARFDVGLTVDHIGGGSFMTQLERRAGSIVRVAALLRWRYVEGDWGSLYMRLSPGLAIFSHSDELRSRIAFELGGDPQQFDSIDVVNAGFTFGFDFGLMIYATRWLGVFVEFEGITSTTTVSQGDNEVDLVVGQPIVALGIEARL